LNWWFLPAGAVHPEVGDGRWVGREEGELDGAAVAGAARDRDGRVLAVGDEGAPHEDDPVRVAVPHLGKLGGDEGRSVFQRSAIDVASRNRCGTWALIGQCESESVVVGADADEGMYNTVPSLNVSNLSYR
jgi:hypothetical protein